MSLALLVAMFAVGALEIAHFSRGTSLMLEVGYFAIPAAVAVARVPASCSSLFYAAHQIEPLTG